MPKLLIADDSMFQRFNLAKTAREAGYEVLEATNGREALAKSASEAPEIILLDLNMPDIGGLEVLAGLRESGSRARVMVVTADIQDTTRQRCLELGVADFLNKPVAPGLLLEKLAMSAS